MTLKDTFIGSLRPQCRESHMENLADHFAEKRDTTRVIDLKKKRNLRKDPQHSCQAQMVLKGETRNDKKSPYTGLLYTGNIGYNRSTGIYTPYATVDGKGRGIFPINGSGYWGMGNIYSMGTTDYT